MPERLSLVGEREESGEEICMGTEHWLHSHDIVLQLERQRGRAVALLGESTFSAPHRRYV